MKYPSHIEFVSNLVENITPEQELNSMIVCYYHDFRTLDSMKAAKSLNDKLKEVPEDQREHYRNKIDTLISLLNPRNMPLQ